MKRYYNDWQSFLSQLKDEKFTIKETELVLLGTTLINVNRLDEKFNPFDLYQFFFYLDMTLDRNVITNDILGCSIPIFYKIRSDIKNNVPFRELLSSGYVRRLNRFKNLINLYLVI